VAQPHPAPGGPGRLLCQTPGPGPLLPIGRFSAVTAITRRRRMPERRRFPPPTADELDALAANLPMTAEQAKTLRRLAEAAYELEAFKPNLRRAEADLRIAALTAKLKLLDGPPHTL
jgi:hypothetical protein